MNILFQFLSSLNMMDYSLLIGIHDTEHVDSDPEDEHDGEDGFETGEDSADGLDEPSSPDDTDATPRFTRTESTSSNSGSAYDSDFFLIHCNDGTYSLLSLVTYEPALTKESNA